MDIGFIMDMEIAPSAQIDEAEVIDLYRGDTWSAEAKPAQPLLALRNCHALSAARNAGRLAGMANAISDGYLVVYYSHMLVHPELQNRGVGRRMMEAIQSIYGSYHQQMITAEVEVVRFHESVGFKRAGKALAMWIYSGKDH